MDLGTYQLGVELPLSLQCVDADQVPNVPLAAPIATVYGPTQALIVRREMAADLQGVATAFFRLPVQLDSRFSAVGLYAVTLSWKDSAGTVRVRAGSFLLRASPTNASDGAVVSMKPLLTPAAVYLLRQTDSGLYAKGRNPR